MKSRLLLPAGLHQVPPSSWLQLSLWVSVKSALAAVGMRVAGDRPYQWGLVSGCILG